MTQKKSSKPEDEEIEVTVEGEDKAVDAAGLEPDAKKDEPAEPDADVEALRKQLEELKSAREQSQNRALEAERRAVQAAQQLESLRHSNVQTNLDALATAMGAAQIEIDAAKQDILIAGHNQDFSALADAQDRLAAARTRFITLENSKVLHEQHKPEPRDPIESNPNLSYEEKAWLRKHPDAINDHRQFQRLNAAYYDAVEKNLTRGSDAYFEFLEERLGYRKADQGHAAERTENSAMVAAPPSKGGNTGGGGGKTRFTLTKEEAEIAKLAGITPAEYVKQREYLNERKKQGDYTGQP